MAVSDSTEESYTAAKDHKTSTQGIRTDILIVDDSPVDRRLAAAHIEKRSSLNPLVASGGQQALDMLAKKLPAVVVTDLQMPGLNGLELVQAIRRQHPCLPVILMTAYGSEEIAIEALRAGASNYVRKQVMATELLDTLNAILALADVDQRRRRLLDCIQSDRSTYQLGNDPELISPLIAMFQEQVGGLGVTDCHGQTRVGVALQEALSNALYHGNLEVSSELRQDDERLFYNEVRIRRQLSPYRDRAIHVTADLHRDVATFRIRDEGPGFDTTKLNAPFDPESLMRVGGRGLILIRSFMDEVHYNDRGNEITLIKKRCTDSSTSCEPRHLACAVH